MEDYASQLETSLNAIKNVAANKNVFYIPEDVRSIVTKDLVTDLTTPYVPDHQQKQFVEDVLQYGARLFCILSLMGRLDVLRDFLTHNTRDSKLPCQEAEVQRIAPCLDACLFSELQQQFFPWSFKRSYMHAILPDETVIPFTSEHIIGEGAQGTISVVAIPFELQDFEPHQDGSTVQVVRKCIKPARDVRHTEIKFDGERECLELYHNLRHPSIIPLLGSYTIRGHHSLLFPRYEMNLEEFFKQDRMGDFHSHVALSAAIADLASAVQTVHEVTVRSEVRPLYLTKYGFHHDIRPANILVSDGKLILADFGLAYPKPYATDQPPTRLWDPNVGHYIAPECMDECLESRIVGRSYDIWAFGCLLAELATYMEKGPDGVVQFRKARETATYYDLPWGNGYFFEANPSGQGVILKSEVTSWLQSLTDACTDNITQLLVTVSKQMLAPEPENRPAMTQSHAHLRFGHLKHLFELATLKIEETLSKAGLPRFELSATTKRELETELRKLRAFGEELGLSDPVRIASSHLSTASYADFVADKLREISDNLQQSTATLSSPMPVWTAVENGGMVKQLKQLKHVDEPIRKIIRELCESLPDQVSLDNLLAKVPVPGEPLSASQSQDAFLDLSLKRRFQQVNEELHRHTETSTRPLQLDWSHFTPGVGLGRYHQLAEYRGSEISRDGPAKVLFEWVFPSQFPQGESATSRSDKLLALVGLLSSPKPKGFRTLDCLGILPPQQNGLMAYAFVYSMPPLVPQDRVRPTTLRELLDRKLGDCSVTLGDKFKIAQAISSSLDEVHRHGWLHKNIRSDNIIFLESTGEDGGKKSRLMSGPWLIGFNRGRQDKQQLLSDLPSVTVDTEALLYQHPDYKYDETRFERNHDRYSLGIVLLEVAYWNPVLEMKKNEKCADIGQFRDRLLSRYVPKVVESMGGSYTKAIEACLRGEFPSRSEEEGFEDMSQFRVQVVHPLEKCHVG